MSEGSKGKLRRVLAIVVVLAVIWGIALLAPILPFDEVYDEIEPYERKATRPEPISHH